MELLWEQSRNLGEEWKKFADIVMENVILMADSANFVEDMESILGLVI